MKANKIIVLIIALLQSITSFCSQERHLFFEVVTMIQHSFKHSQCLFVDLFLKKEKKKRPLFCETFNDVDVSKNESWFCQSISKKTEQQKNSEDERPEEEEKEESLEDEDENEIFERIMQRRHRKEWIVVMIELLVGSCCVGFFLNYLLGII